MHLNNIIIKSGHFAHFFLLIEGIINLKTK
jgi:uncharacterized membrane protein